MKRNETKRKLKIAVQVNSGRISSWQRRVDGGDDGVHFFFSSKFITPEISRSLFMSLRSHHDCYCLRCTYKIA